MKRYLPRSLSLLLAIALLSACSSGDGGGVQEPAAPASEAAVSQPAAETEGGLYTEPGTFPIVNSPVELKIFAPLPAYIIDFETNQFTQFLEELTGVNLTFEVAPVGDALKEKSQLILASGDLPDVFMFGDQAGNFPSTTKYGVEEGSFIDLTDLIETKMTEFHVLQERHPELMGSMKESDGKIYALPYFAQAFHMTYYSKMWVNQGYLDEMGEEIPKTTADFERVCWKFMEMKPDGVAIAGFKDGAGSDPIPFLSGGFTYHPGMYSKHGLIVENGTVKTMMNTDGYREALRFARGLSQSGCLYDGLFTMDSNQARALATSEGEPILFLPGHTVMGWIDPLSAPELFAKFRPVAPLEGPDGTRFSVYAPQEPTSTFAVTTACENPEAAVRLADYLYTMEGTNNAYIGVRGPENWDWAEDGQVGVDGSPAIYQFLRPYTSSEPSDIAWNGAGVKYRSAYVRLGEAVDPDVDLYTAEGLEKLIFDASKDLYEPCKPEGIINLPGTLKLTSDENQSIQTISIEVEKLLNDYRVQFVTGTLDIEADWDAYVQGMESMGMGKLTEVYQAAYDRQYK